MHALTKSLAGDPNTFTKSTAAFKVLVGRYIKHNATTQDTGRVNTVIEHCFRLEAYEEITQFFSGLALPTISATYTSSILVPALQKLNALATDNGTLQILAPAYQKTLLVWVEHVLNFPAAISRARAPSPCKCGQCKTLFQFFKGKGGPKTTLSGLEDGKQQHVQKALQELGIQADLSINVTKQAETSRYDVRVLLDHADLRMILIGSVPISRSRS